MESTDVVKKGRKVTSATSDSSAKAQAQEPREEPIQLGSPTKRKRRHENEVKKTKSREKSDVQPVSPLKQAPIKRDSHKHLKKKIPQTPEPVSQPSNQPVLSSSSKPSRPPRSQSEENRGKAEKVILLLQDHFLHSTQGRGIQKLRRLRASATSMCSL